MKTVKKIRLSDTIFGFLLLLPVLILLAVIYIYPISYGILLSFHRRTPWATVGEWVGINNYIKLFQNPDFINALKNGVLFSVGSVAFQILIGLIIALVVRESFKGQSIVRTIVLAPYMIPTICTAMIMRWIFNDMYGVSNYFLKTLGIINNYITFFGNKYLAMPTLIFANSWQFGMFVTLIFLARLLTINPNLYEAAEIMGASSWHKFRDITLPSLKGVFLLSVLLRSIWMFNKFDIIWLITHGGPFGRTTTLPIFTYLKSFRGFQFGMGASISTVTFLILSVFAIVYFIIFKPEEEVEV